MKVTECQKIMKLRETKWETQPIPRAGLSCSVRARPLEGLAGRHSPASELTRTKHTDCPQNPAAPHGLGEHGLGEHGLGEHGLGEHGLGEHGTTLPRRVFTKAPRKPA